MWCQLRKWGNLRTRGRIIKSLTVEFSSWCCLGGQLCKQKQRCQTTLAIHSSEMRAIEQKHVDPEPFKISLKNSEEWFHGRLLKIFFLHFGVRQKHQRHQGGTFWTVGFRPGSELGSARKDLESQDANLGGEAPSVSTVSRFRAVAAFRGIQLYCSMGGQLPSGNLT